MSALLFTFDFRPPTAKGSGHDAEEDDGLPDTLHPDDVVDRRYKGGHIPSKVFRTLQRAVGDDTPEVPQAGKTWTRPSVAFIVHLFQNVQVLILARRILECHFTSICLLLFITAFHQTAIFSGRLIHQLSNILSYQPHRTVRIIKKTLTRHITLIQNPKKKKSEKGKNN